MSKPVILHVSAAYTWRGGEQQLAYLAGELKLMDVTQYVLCISGSAVETYCIHAHIPYFVTDKRSSLDLFFAKKIASICKRNKIEIVHAHDTQAHTFSVLANDIFGCKSAIVISQRTDSAIKNNFFFKYKYNHTDVKKIICVSDKIRNIVESTIKEPSKVVTVHDGIDSDRFKHKRDQHILHEEFGLESNIKLIANISVLASHKDHFTFIDTASIICRKRNDVCFFIIGDGPSYEAIKDRIKKSGFASRIIMTGFRTDIPDIFPELDVFLLTSESEGLGTSILDAFACRVPVVATNTGGIPEIVKHESTGLLSNVKDSVSLALQVEKLLNDDNLSNQLTSQAAIELSNFTTLKTAEKTLAYYNELSSQKQ